MTVSYLKQNNFQVGNLITSTEHISPGMLVKDVAGKFFRPGSPEAIALVECREPVGLITKNKFLLRLFRLYGFDLYGRKPIISLADTEPLYINSEEKLDAALDAAMNRPCQDIYDELVVVDSKGHYKGLLVVKELVIRQSRALADSIVQKELANAKASELEKLHMKKSQFLALATHELRSPVNAIILLAELMRISCEKGHIEQLKDRLSLLLSSSAGLKSIINNVLDLSKIEAGKMEAEYEKFDAVAKLAEVLETTRVLLGSKPVDVRLEARERPLHIESDPTKFRQIFINLMSNAAKFTAEGSITVTAEGDEGDSVIISVKDTGPGIKKEDLEKLFTAFSRIEHSKTRRHEGTGLGLTVAKYLTQLLRGQLRVESEWGKGTTFLLRLPRKKPELTMDCLNARPGKNNSCN